MHQKLVAVLAWIVLVSWAAPTTAQQPCAAFCPEGFFCVSCCNAGSCVADVGQPRPTPCPCAPPLTPTIHIACPGDCNQNGVVTVAELIRIVSFSLLPVIPPNTPNYCGVDSNLDESISINEIVAAVNSALHGCARPAPTSTPSPTGTPQPPGPCDGAIIDPPGLGFPGCFTEGRERQLTISLEAPSTDCCWTAALRNDRVSYYLTVDGPTAGCGSAEVLYTLTENNGTQRGGTIDFRDDGGVLFGSHTINQANHCTVTPSRTRTPTPTSTPR